MHWILLPPAAAVVAFMDDSVGATGEMAAAAAMMMRGWWKIVMVMLIRKTESEAGAILRRSRVGLNGLPGLGMPDYRVQANSSFGADVLVKSREESEGFWTLDAIFLIFYVLQTEHDRLRRCSPTSMSGSWNEVCDKKICCRVLGTLARRQVKTADKPSLKGQVKAWIVSEIGNDKIEMQR